MHVWTLDAYKEIYKNTPLRAGVRLVCDADIDSELREQLKELIVWLRGQYVFPMRD